MKFFLRVFFICLICALLPVLLGAALSAGRGTAWPAGLLLGLGLLSALAAALAATALVRRELRQASARLGRTLAGLPQETPLEAPAASALPELDDRLAEVAARLRELAALRETALDLTGELDMDRLLNTIAERAAALLGVSGGHIYEFDPARRKLRMVAGRTPHQTGVELDLGEGLAGRVAQTGQPLVVHDYQNWPGRSQRFAGFPTANVLGVPLRWRGELIGVLNLDDEVVRRRFSERDVALAEQFASQAALAIGNARNYAALKRQAERLAILHQASQAITLHAAADLEQVYAAIYQAVGRLMPNDSFGIVLKDPAGGHVETMYVMEAGRRLPDVRVPADTGLTGYMLGHGQPVLFQSAQEWLEHWPAGFVNYGQGKVQSILAVPLKAGEMLLGYLTTQSPNAHAFREEDIPLLTLLANQAASAIHTARLFRSARRQLSELSILQEVARAAVSTPDPDQVINRAMQALHQRVGYDYLSLYLIDPASGALHLRSCLSAHPLEQPSVYVPPGAGIVGYVAHTGQAVRVADVTREPRYLSTFSDSRSGLGVPLQVGERLIGVLNAEATTPDSFNADEERLLTIVAGLLAPIIETARGHERERQQLSELSLLNEITQAAISASDLDAVIAQPIQVLQRRLGYDMIGIHLIDATGQRLVAHPSYAGLPEAGRLPPVALGSGIVGQAAQTGQALRVDDVTADPGSPRLFPEARSALAVPLEVADRVIGVINTASRRPAAYTETDEQVLSVAAGLLAPLIDNAGLRARAEQHARELDVVLQAQVAASASLDLGAVLTTMVEQIGRALDVTSAYVCELNETYAMTLAEYYGPHATDLERTSDLNVPYPAGMFVAAQRALAAARPEQLSLDDPDLAPGEREHLEQFGGRAALIVPLIQQGRPLGYVKLWETRRDRRFSDDELRLAQTLAGSLASALENAKLYQAARRRVEQMRLVNEVARDIAGLLDIEALLVQVSQRLETAFGYYHATVGLVDGGQVVFPSRADARRGTQLPELRRPVDGPGLIAWVARQGEPRLAADIAQEPDFVANPLFPETRSEAVTPLMAYGRVIGVLDVQSEKLAGLGPEDLNTLQAISAQLAVAVENARLFAEVQQRADEVSALLATTVAVTSSLDVGARLEAIAHHARRLVGGDVCTLYRLDASGQKMRPIMTLDEEYAEQVLAEVVPVGEGILGYVAQTGVGELISRTDLDPRGKHIAGTPLNPESLLAVPLRVGDRVTGVMAVYREGLRSFQPHDLELMSSFAAQAAVAIENAELYQALVERANSLQAAYDELASVDQLKDELVQNVSHELRTPLTFLRSYVELLLTGQLGPLLPEQEKGLRVVADKTNTLVRLVNDIITLQAVTPETIKLVPLDLGALARAAADGVAAAADQAGIQLSVNAPEPAVVVLGDPLRLMQVFDNLLGNALKYVERGGEINLTIQPMSDSVRVEVRDTGIGIAPQNLERIFDRFYQVDGALTRRRSGLGLGLSICKLIVEAHSGYIGVASQLGQGACFYFTLPLPDPARLAAAEVSQSQVKDGGPDGRH